MLFSNSQVLLSFMAFRVLKGIIMLGKEYQWFRSSVIQSYNQIQQVIERGQKKNYTEKKMRDEIKDVVFSPPYLGMLFIDKDVQSAEQAVEEAYEYIKNVYLIYVKRIPSTPEFNIYKYLQYTKDSDLYNVSNGDLKSKIRLYSNPNFNHGNIEKSTVVIVNYLKKYYKNYYL